MMGPPCCTYWLHVPASCVLHVPEAQGSLPLGPHALYVRRTCTRFGGAVRTAYRVVTTGSSRGQDALDTFNTLDLMLHSPACEVFTRVRVRLRLRLR
eukprot:scaffold126656_cov33-Phaeocystis_antarctica.AAC.1